jgi:hypothetical protein
MSTNIPISLEGLTVTEFHGIHNVEIPEIPPVPWVFFTGDTGAGKTSLLRAIAVGLNGVRDGKRILANDSAEIVARVRRNGHRSAVCADPDVRGAVSEFAAYGDARRRLQRYPGDIDAPEMSPTYSLFHDDGPMFNFEAWLEYHRDTDAIHGPLLRGIPYLADIAVEANEREQRFDVYYTEVEPETGITSPPARFHRLTSGVKAMLALVCDIWRRLSKHHEMVSRPDLFAGIVLIDELENHLCPKLQRQLPAVLSGMFPRVQFIASTNSVGPILGAPADAVAYRLYRSGGDTRISEPYKLSEMRQLTANGILTSPLIGMDHARMQALGDREVDTSDDYLHSRIHRAISKQVAELRAQGRVYLSPETIDDMIHDALAKYGE